MDYDHRMIDNIIQYRLNILGKYLGEKYNLNFISGSYSTPPYIILYLVTGNQEYRGSQNQLLDMKISFVDQQFNLNCYFLGENKTFIGNNIDYLIKCSYQFALGIISLKLERDLEKRLEAFNE